MNRTFYIYILTLFLTFSVNSSVYAEGFIKKEVYFFKDKNGNLVFTDKQPLKEKHYKKQTIEAANSTKNNKYTANEATLLNTNTNQEKTIKLNVEDRKAIKKKKIKQKLHLKRCKTYKRKFKFYSDKMKTGYKNSEYKNLERNRKKYRNLLFENCETKIF